MIETKEVMDAVQSEVRFLNDRFKCLSREQDVLLSLRAVMNQLLNCYHTVDEHHSKHLVRHMAGIVQVFFQQNNFAQVLRPSEPMQTFSDWLLKLDNVILGSVQRSLENPASIRSDLMTVLNLLFGCMRQYGVEPRQGYDA